MAQTIIIHFDVAPSIGAGGGGSAEGKRPPAPYRSNARLLLEIAIAAAGYLAATTIGLWWHYLP